MADVMRLINGPIRLLTWAAHSRKGTDTPSWGMQIFRLENGEEKGKSGQLEGDSISKGNWNSAFCKGPGRGSKKELAKTVPRRRFPR